MSELTGIGDAIAEGPDSVYVRAIGHMKGWPVDKLPGGEAERDSRVESYSAMLAAHRGLIPWDEAHLIGARCDSKWLLNEPKLRVALPKPATAGGEAWLTQILAYTDVGQLLSVPMAAKLDEQARRSFKDNEQSFRNWFAPVVEHQTRCERHYLALCAFGDTSDTRTCRDVFARGQLVHGQLVTVKDSKLGWLPPFRFQAPGHDVDWRKRIGVPVEAGFPNMAEWWERFRIAHEQFLPTRTPLEFVAAPPEPEPEPEEEPPPPEQPYGNFGERDEDVDLW